MAGWMQLLGTVLGQVANVAMTRKNNADNRKLAEYQNAQSQQQSNIAYERSKPTNQVANLMQAGMSKAGALNVLSGGGSYQPAPVSSSTSQAPQVDLSHAFDGLLQSAENAKQRKMQEDLLNKQIAASKASQQAQIASDEKKHAAQLESNERIAEANRTSNETIASERLKFDREVHDKLSPYQIRLIDAQIAKYEKDVEFTDVQRQNLANYIAEYYSQEYKDTRAAKNLLEKLQNEFNYKITNKGFEDYLNENYDYNPETGEYEVKQWHKNAGKVQQGARVIWQTIFELIPVNQLLEALGGTVENVKAIKLLSKVK